MSGRLLPLITQDTRDFWTGGEFNELRIHRCTECGRYAFPPMPMCAVCRKESMRPVPVSGRGSVYSFSINHQPFLPGMEVPFCAAMIELEEQAALRVVSKVVNCPLDDVRIGMPVEVLFEKFEDVWLPLFQPAGQSGSVGRKA